ncbi:MAG: transposase [Polaromonas sp.]
MRRWLTAYSPTTAQEFCFIAESWTWRWREGKITVELTKSPEGKNAAGLPLTRRQPEKWVVDCKSVGSGEKVLVYLGRYLYRGVIQEKDILRCEDGQVIPAWKLPPQRTLIGNTKRISNTSTQGPATQNH